MQDFEKSQHIQVISRASSILRCLGRNTGGMSLGKIAAEVELPRSTVQRIVGALSQEGLVSTGPRSSGIRLGPEIHALARAVALDPKDRYRPVMQQIAKATGETVDLAVLRGGQMLFVDQIVGTQRLRAVSSIGERFPLTTTANGKAALACLDELEASQTAMAELKKMGPGAPKLAALLTEVDQVRSGALARDDGEHTEGISALGFGVTDPGGDVFAISVPVPSSRFVRVEKALVTVLDRIRERAVQAG